MASDREVQKGFDFLDAMPRYRRVTANAVLMSDALHAENGTPITPDVLRRVFSRIQPQLAVNREYEQAYETFFEQFPQYKMDANMAILDAALVRLREPVTAENLEELLHPGNPHNVLSQLGVTQEYARAQADEQERQAIITQLTKTLVDSKGKPLIDGRGRQVTYDEKGRLVGYKDEAERIKNASLEELRRIRDDRAERQRLRSLPNEELVKIANQDRQVSSQFAPLPPTYAPPGKPEVSVPWSVQLLKRLPPSETKRLIRFYGADAINAAIAAKGN